MDKDIDLVVAEYEQKLKDKDEANKLALDAQKAEFEKQIKDREAEYKKNIRDIVRGKVETSDSDEKSDEDKAIDNLTKKYKRS